jgi:hypothetical protein
MNSENGTFSEGSGSSGGVGEGVGQAASSTIASLTPIAAFRKPFGILLFAVLFAVGTEVLRRQTLREFPHGESGKIGERIRERLRRRAAPPTAPAPSVSAQAGQLDQLERLAALRREGALTDEEFAAQKAHLLAQ